MQIRAALDGSLKALQSGLATEGCSYPSTHLLSAIARAALPCKHRLAHVLHAVGQAAAYAARAVKVAVGGHHRIFGQARLVL